MNERAVIYFATKRKYFVSKCNKMNEKKKENMMKYSLLTVSLWAVLGQDQVDNGLYVN